MGWVGINPVEWANKTAPEAVESAIKKAATAYFSAIIKSSPVDEGTFRGNWYASIDTPSNETSSARTQSVAESAMAGLVKSAQNWSVLYLTNNLPYASVIEYGGYGEGPKTIGGYSRQAPQGVVRVNAIRFNSLLDEAVR